MGLPCEFIARYVIPSIRKEIVRILSQRYGMNNREIARRLKLTDAAVSQYLSRKRGIRFEINGRFLDMLEKSAERIAEKDADIDEEICKICREMKGALI